MSPARASGQPGSTGVAGEVALAVAVATVAILPMFLLGALVGAMRADLDFEVVAVGLATAALFAVSSAAARLTGSIVQRLGCRRGTVLASLLAAAALGAGALAHSFVVLLLAMGLAGAANATAQPAANLRLSRLTAGSGAGLAFGIKQSAVPAASLLAGLAVPASAAFLGWRSVWATGSVLALGLAAFAAFCTRDPIRPTGGPVLAVGRREMPTRELVVLSVGGCLATAACTSLGVFLVDAGVVSGLRPAQAGILVAACAVVGLVTRVGLGLLTDAHPHRNVVAAIVGLLVLGGLGFVLLAVGSPALFVVGAFLTYGAGWAWPGLLHYGVVRDNALAPASATGVLQTGLSLGAALGPLSFGVVVAEVSYGAAWSALAALSLVAAVTMAWSQRPPRLASAEPVGRARRGA